MRKILTSVLSVAGLLAVVLALASSPASAAKEVVTIQTDGTPSQAGTYTVSWETQGGCDPGSGTSGASGSVTLTVADADGAGTATTGPQQETGVVTDVICNYSWKATFTNAAGAACVIGGTDTSGTTAANLVVTDAGLLSLVTADCAATAKIHVTVKAPGVNLGDCITAPDGDGGFDNATCETANTADPQTGGFNEAGADDVTDAASAGAAAATTFTITATPEPPTPGGDVPEGCNAASGETETDYDDNSLQKAVLTVTSVALGGANCTYTVSAAVPAGFAAGDGAPRSTGNSQKGQDPGSQATDGGPDGDTTTAGDNNDIVVPDLTVSIGAVKVYLVQNVIGDAGGASASYKYEAPCGAPGLPGALQRIPQSGGISTVEATTVVELRTGRFNISEAISAEATAADGQSATALNNKGEACEATIAVSGVPAHCSVSSNSPASLASASGSVIIEVTVDCSPPPAPEPEPEPEPMDDTGDMGADDMGADDMGGDDMGGDDMGGDDMGDMGPPEDVATG